ETLVGKQIGPYEILLLLGKGGMGELYLADDTRLDRKVALKFLSNKFTNDAWSKRQLMKEAQAIARLDHPNICAVHGFEEHDGYNFIVMQCIDGKTLASLISKGRIEQRAGTLRAEELRFYLGLLAREADRLEYLITERDHH
ncbi:MAG TPA: protein kinase, partial [Blastocatellia bacterium]